MAEKVEIEEIELARVQINWGDLDKWIKPNSDDLPVYSFLSIYEACGLQPIFQKYYDENNNKQIIAADNLMCNFYTLQAMKNYIERNWQVYSLDINGDNHVFWKKSKYGKTQHYPKTLSKKIKACLAADFGNFCPGLDDELPDNTLVFKVYNKRLVEKNEEN